MELIDLFKNAQSNQTLILVPEHEYHVYQEDAFEIKGMYLSNTCTYEENPRGEKRAALYLNNKNNITIEGNHAKIILHGLITPFIFENCTNIKIRNLSFITRHPTMSEIKIINQNENKFLIKIHPDCLYAIKGNKLFFHSEKGKDGQYYWQYDYRDYLNICMFKNLNDGTTRTQIRSDDCKFPCAPKFKSIRTTDAKNILEVELENERDYFQVNSVMQIRPTIRDQVGGAFVNCKNVVMESCAFASLHGFGILAERSENLIYQKNRIIPINDRTIACNADFYHFSSCRGKIKIVDNFLQEGHDDFVNVHGIHLKVKERIDSHTLVVKFMNDNTFGFNPFFKKDQVAFIDQNNLTIRGKNIVVNSRLINLKEILLTLKKPVSSVITEYCIENVSASPQVCIRNNHFGPSMSRGILVTTRKKALIKNNAFYKLGGSALYIANDCNFWYESGPIKNVKFIKNVIIDSAYNPFGYDPHPFIALEPVIKDKKYHGFTHHKVLIKRNKFISSQLIQMFVSYTKKFILKKNISNQEVMIKCVSSNVKKDKILKTKPILLIGDSIAFGEGATAFRGWAYLLNAHRDYQVINHSTRGFSAFNYKDTFEDYVKTTCPEAKIMISLGINDSMVINNKAYETIEDFKKHLDYFVGIARRYQRDLIFIGPTRVDETKTTPISWSIDDAHYLNERIELYDATIRQICKANHLTYISLKNVVNHTLLADGLHPNDAGHRRIYKKILRNLKKVLR